ncbi:uncharacterized protein J3D65DRAFT_618694 [Phyllosticta citribraziliensis]|uniref:BTB domain-containing protein n=1 Tax=Phyllosticta citribraziliensis TaxID=989973 RepID=A0ABR1LWB2_9PEZI
MHWRDSSHVTFVRDFAYPHLRRQRRRLRIMASTAANVGDTSAKSFAEYVQPEPLPHPIFPSDPVNLGPQDAQAQARRPLPYRIHSHRLRVQAHAKNVRARLLSGPLIDVYVGTGEEKRHWALHRNVLCYHSEYLASELQTNESTKNKTSNKLELVEDDPKGFELLVKWLYQGKLEDVSSISDAGKKFEYAVACHKLYLLCERFDMPELKNMAIDQYRKGLNQARLVPDADEINEIYRESPEGSPFRTLVTRIAARQLMDPDNDKDAEDYRACFDSNPDFAVDLVNAIKSGTGGQLFTDPTSGDECEYHDHEGGIDCHNRTKGKGTGLKKHRFRPLSPPSPPSTPPETPFETPLPRSTSANFGASQPAKSSQKVEGDDAHEGLNGDQDDGYGDEHLGDSGGPSRRGPGAYPATPPTAKSGSGERGQHHVGLESPGGGSPKRQPPKLRKRSDAIPRHALSEGDF